MSEEESYFSRLIAKLEENNIELPDNVVEKAKTIFQMASERKLFRGITFVTITTACLYAAIRTSECMPISLNKFLRSCDISYEDKEFGWSNYRDMVGKTGVAKIYRKLIWTLKTKPKRCVLRPTIFVEQYTKELKMPKRLWML